MGKCLRPISHGGRRFTGRRPRHRSANSSQPEWQDFLCRSRDRRGELAALTGASDNCQSVIRFVGQGGAMPTCRWRFLLCGLCALTLGACATYRVAPLAPLTDETLRGPALAALVAPAASLRHPTLKPVSIDPDRPLTPDALAVIAVLANPDLKAARAKAAVASAQVFQAGLLPDPSFNFGYDFRLSGPDPANAWAAALAYELTALRDRGVELKAARAAAQQVRLDLAWQEWQTAEQAKLLAVRIGGLQIIGALDAETKTASDVTLGRVMQAAARGDLKADEVEIRRLAALDASDKFASGSTRPRRCAPRLEQAAGSSTGSNLAGRLRVAGLAGGRECRGSPVYRRAGAAPRPERRCGPATTVRMRVCARQSTINSPRSSSP